MSTNLILALHIPSLSYHTISSLSYHTIYHYITSHHIIIYRIILYHVMSYHIISYHVIDWFIISYYIILYRRLSTQHLYPCTSLSLYYLYLSYPTAFNSIQFNCIVSHHITLHRSSDMGKNPNYFLCNLSQKQALADAIDMIDMPFESRYE